MKIVKEGDKSKAVCDTCGLTSVTYRLRDVPFTDDVGIVKNILAGVCDQCGHVVSVPRQCTPKIKAVYEAKKSAEYRLPAHFIDILSLASSKIDDEIGDALSKPLLLYYVHKLNNGEIPAKIIKELLSSELASAPSTKRLSLKITERTERELGDVVQKTGLHSSTELIKGIILKIYEDIVKPKTPKHMKELKTIAATFG
ncbi:hypothetical protein [Geomesophilobacter sediminis]|uniref:Uncharacterized protein n=1 Tax=Geomesophilobacter sediminis TaxID=2798584 RepID=A0A8J7S7W2_9BACT|nr:hypothetical protein [Geomesophilobacter sediminis]MBJ6727177.1 hypothetical protein [Geomesophilobacter sediminis]